MQAESNKQAAQDLLARIEKRYFLKEPAVIERFLVDHPNIMPKLDEVSALIPTFFPKTAMHLRVLKAAPVADAPDGRRLLLFIATDVPKEQAMHQMDLLMDAWRPDVRWRPAAPFSVGVAPGTTVHAVDQAAQSFMQTHAPLDEGHRELVRRLQESEPGTLEHGIAHAEFLAGLAAELGIQLPTSGGDALMMLARLRRQARTQS